MEPIENQDVSEGELSLPCKKKIKRKRSISIKLGNLSLAYGAEATQQHTTTNVKTNGAEMIDDSNEEDYVHKSIFKPENIATFSEKNVRQIKDVRKKLKQNKNEEEMKKKSKKKLKNIEVTHQQTTKNVKAVGGWMIDDSSEENYMHKSIFKQEPEKVATLSEKNVKEIKYVRKKLKQNKNKEEMEKKNKNKLKNIEVTHKQMTKNVKAVSGEMIDDSSEEDYMHKSIFKQEPENVATLSEKNVKEIKYVRKKLKQNKNEEEMEKKSKKKLKNIEVTHQQMTKNVKAVDGWMIDDSSEEDYMLKSIFKQEPENVATLSEKNVKEIKYVRKKLKQNKNEEEMEKKSKKKLKNIEVTHHQMTKNVKTVGGWMIDDSSEEDYTHKFIFKQEPENVATLSEKNVKKIKDVRKKLKQNKNEEEMKTKNKKKVKNIEVTQQQMTTNVKTAGAEMIDDSSKEDYIPWSIFIQETENFATLSEKNVKEIKDVRKKLKQNKKEEQMEKKSEKKLKNIEVTQQITTNVKAVGAEMIDDSNEENYIHRNIFIQESENFGTLSEKDVKEIKYVRKKLDNRSEEEEEKIDKNKLESIEETQQQMTTTVEVSHNDIITEPNKADCICVPVYIRKSENFATLPEKNDKKIKYIPEKFEQSSEEVDKNSLTKLLTDSEEKMNKILNNETTVKLLEDIKTNDESIIIRRQIRGEDKVTDAKTENDDVNNNCQTTVNNKSIEHRYMLNEIVEVDQAIKIVEENEIKEVENMDPGTTSNETLFYVILENNSKMINRTLMVEDISIVAHEIDNQIDVRKNWWTIYIENMFSRLLFLFLLLLLFLLFCNCK